MRTVVVGGSSGLDRCIGVGLAHRGARVALVARRMADGWDPSLADELVARWFDHGWMNGGLGDAFDLADGVEMALRRGASLHLPSAAMTASPVDSTPSR